MVRSCLIVLFCILVGGPSSAQDVPEFDVPASPPRPARQPGPGFDLAPELELMAGAQALGGNDDMHETYGLLPSAGLGVSCRLGGAARGALTVCYAQSGGDPYHASPEFQLDDASRLRAVPITLGVRMMDPSSESWRANVGIGLQLAWIEERLPDDVDGGSHVLSGWGAGLLVSFATEWRSRSDRRAVGLELAVGGCGGDIGEGYRSHEVDLTGLQARLYTAVRLGGKQAVQP